MSAVYFARVGDYVKIGFAADVNRRMKTLLKGARLTCPDDLDRSQSPDLILVIPFCRMRDERNMQLLFAGHWVVGEWFRWSPEFQHQMQTMQFVTHATRLRWLREARRDLGVVGEAVKEARWGMQTPELLADLKARAADLADTG